MRQYFIASLYVVESKSNNFNEYFICLYDKLEDKYIEIFTGLKIKNSHNKNIEPLSVYYAPLYMLCNPQESIDSLFLQYASINYVNTLLNYNKDNLSLNNSIYNTIKQDDFKHIGIKKYHLENLYLVNLYYGLNYICTYNKSKYKHIFTDKIIDDNNITKITNLSNYYNPNLEKKISSFTLLQIYNAINYINVVSKCNEDFIKEELNNRGIYKNSNLYKKLTKK